MIKLAQGIELMTSRAVTVSVSTLAISLLLATAAPAATFKNLDPVDHKITVVDGEQRQEYVLEAKRELTDVCSNVCNIYIGDDPDPYEIGAAESFEIEGGQLYTLEAPETGSSPATPSQ